MTYEKRAEQYCKNCKEYNLCIWVKQKRYSNCIDGQNFMAGWECGQSDTWRRWRSIYRQYIVNKIEIWQQLQKRMFLLKWQSY